MHTERAINALVKYVDGDNPTAAVAAANALLDRAYGKPRQQIDSTITRKIVTDERARAIRELLKAPEGRSVQ